MLTELQQKVLDLSRALPAIDEDKEFSENYAEMMEEVSFNAYELLTYNNSYNVDGHWLTDIINEMFCLKHIINVGDYIVMRICMMSVHTELAPWEDSNITQNMTDNQIDQMMMDADDTDEYCYEKQTEVAQVWFTPDGKVVTLQCAKLSDDQVKPHDIVLSRYNIECEDDIDFHGGFDLNSPLMPVDDVDGELLDHHINHYFEDQFRHTIVSSLCKGAAFELFKGYIKQKGRGNDFKELVRQDEPIALTLLHWGYDKLWSMYIAQGMASSAAKYYHTIKVAHRNGFEASAPERQVRWMALLDDIKFCNGNIQDPRNYMPVDFDRMEAYWQERVRNKKRLMAIEAEKRRKEEEELRRLSQAERREREDLDYQQRRGIMRALVIGNDKMYARVIQDVTEFYEEGKEQGFCIYNSRYFTFPDMLCFTVRDAKTDKRLSTVTYDMRNEIIEANLTKGDQVPEMFDEIEALFMEHKDIIRDLWQRCPDFIRPSESGLAAQECAHDWNLQHRDKEQAQKDAILARRAKAAQTAAAKQQTIVIAHAI